MNIDEMSETVRGLSFRDWRFELRILAGYPYLQIAFKGACAVTGGVEEWRGRKWLLSEHMTKSEVVQTALLATLTAVEHEARESFTFKGHRLFGPHINIDHMVEICENLDARTPPPPSLPGP